MVVTNFNATGLPFIPCKAHTPLAVDRDTPQPGTFVFQCFQPINHDANNYEAELMSTVVNLAFIFKGSRI